MKYLFKTIFRNFIRKPVTNIINLLGLAMSFSMVIILSVYCYSELTTDSFHKNGERVYLYGLADHFYTPGVLKEHIDMNVPGVESTVRVGGTWEPPVFQVEGKEPVTSDLVFADEGFFKLFTYTPVEGNLETALQEPLTIVITKTLSEKLYGKEEAVGKIIKLNNDKSLTVRAVIEDLKANSCITFSDYKPVNVPVSSLAIRNDAYASYCITDIKTDNFKTLSTTINDIRKICSELSPSFPVEVSFFDKAIENMYQSELRFRRTFSLLAGCAIVVCSLGILAISIFGCQRRVKEIGIRKVNGARLSEILIMLNEDFIKWVGIAFVISVPISWYIMHKWFSNFAYKTELSWWVFALAGFLALVIALITVSWQSWRAATRNTVEVLRYE